MYFELRPGAERAGVDPRTGDGVEHRADRLDAVLIARGERGGQPRRDHAGGAADRAVEQVPAVGSHVVAEAALAVHADGAHLDVDGAFPQRGERARRAFDDLLDVRRGGDDRQQHVGDGRDLGRAGRHVAARLGQLG